MILHFVVPILGYDAAQATIPYVMVTLMKYLKPVVTAFMMFFALSQPVVVYGQEAVPKANPDMGGVSGLLEQLRDAEPGAAETYADRLRREWSLSGSASADYLLKRGRDAFEREDLKSAVEHFTAVIDHAPGFAQGWAERARVYYEMDLYGPAIGDLEHVIALNPQHFDAIMGLASILDSMDRPEGAYEAYMQVKAIHPHQPGLTEALARLEPRVRGRDL
ncbi:hypothetical protein CLV88_12125 [Shimia abyssi]|uniref:Uncharacterized protein n=1 Tax=Shimia abyssi TaxID=1662395 RepID=A0A2P8F5Z7_9RHOB|nr:hypothetical protein CLV88_12125 [Shimia abyssi]